MRTLSKHNPMPGPARATALLLPALAVFGASAAAAGEVNWDQVEGKTIKTFYPGVASWDFVRGADHGSGAPVVRKMTKACADCHVGKSGEYDIAADKIVSGELKASASKKPLEPQPISGMAGFKDLEIKVAYDSAKIYLRFRWAGSGASVADPALAGGAGADAISVQINGNIRSFASFGCFIACHDDQAGMPRDSGQGTKLYGYYTREGSGLKPQAKLDEHLTKGQFIDAWVVSFAGAAVKATDEYVLQDRLEDRNDLSVTGGFADGHYTVVISRALNTGDSKDIAIAEGGTLNLGVAIHDNRNKGRKHYVSFPVSVGLSSPAVLNAKKL